MQDTHLLDEAVYPTECFGELYHGRWGIQTFYGLLKGRLDLGNFTGPGGCLSVDPTD